MQKRVAILLTVVGSLAIIATLVLTRYGYLSQRLPGRSEVVRTDRWTGETKVLRTNVSSGEVAWKPAAEAPKPVVTEPAAPQSYAVTIPASRLRVSSQPFGADLYLTVTNGSQWRVDSFSVEVGYQGKPGRYPSAVVVHRFDGAESSLMPGETRAFKVGLRGALDGHLRLFDVAGWSSSNTPAPNGG